MSVIDFNNQPIKSDVFRFVSVRNPQRISSSNRNRMGAFYDTQAASQFYLDLVEAIEDPLNDTEAAKLAACQSLSETLRAGETWIENSDELAAIAPDFVDLYEWFMESRATNTIASVTAKLTGIDNLGSEPKSKVWDNLMARLILNIDGEFRAELIETIALSHIVHFHLNEDVVSTDEELWMLIGVRVVLPEAIFPLPGTNIPRQVLADPETEDPVDISALVEEADKYRMALVELEKLQDREVETSRSLVLDDEVAEGATPFTYMAIAQAGIDGFSVDTQSVFSSNLLVEGVRFSFCFTVLEKELSRIEGELFSNARLTKKIVALGGALWQESAREWPTKDSCDPEHPVDMTGYEDFYFADDQCRIRPLGIGDLLKVEQELCCYVPGEVAHIENILQGEYKERSTRRLRRTEETYVSIRESERTTERDTITSNQYELHKETSTILQEDQAFDIGVSASANYGPVQVNVNSNFGTSTSSTTSTAQATSYAQNVTDRSLERIVERTREERIFTIIEEFEENNSHGMDNRQGTGHVVGVYRWADKLYKARLKNYGKRLMFEFLIPEPAAFHLWAMAKPGEESNYELEVPVDPTSTAVTQYGLQPLNQTNITFYNYHLWGKSYGVVLDPPPAMSKRVAVTFGRDGMGSTDKWSVQNQELVIPDGYRAVTATVMRAFNAGGTTTNPPTAPYGWTWIQVGASTGTTIDPNKNQRTSSGINYFTLNGEEGKLPISIVGAETEHIAVNVVVECALTMQALMDWKKEGFRRVMEAYEQKKSAYQNALAEAKAGYGLGFKAVNPAISKQLIENELKKGCLNWMHNGGSFSTDAMAYYNSTSDCQPPQFIPDCCTISDAERVKFLEQAFDWRNMTYLLYPYFYANKCRWKMLYQLDDSDPLFLNFLQAGMARVVVPVQLGFEEVAMHYLRTGQVWGGGPVPAINSNLYLSIVHELYGRDVQSTTAGKEWEIRVPTTLTVLQCGSGCISGDGLPCDCGEGIGKDGGKTITGGSWDAETPAGS